MIETQITNRFDFDGIFITDHRVMRDGTIIGTVQERNIDGLISFRPIGTFIYGRAYAWTTRDKAIERLVRSMKKVIR